MSNSDKNILITPSVGASAEPTIKFTGFSASFINLRVLDDATLSFEGTAGQLFSVSDGLSGTIFSVNDISGIPSIEVLDTGEIRLAEYGGNVGIGTASPISKLHISGSVTANQFVGSLDWTNIVNKPDPTITLGGDLSGSVTLTDLNNATLTATISASANYAINLSDLDDVNVSTASAGQFLKYDGANWISASVAATGGGTEEVSYSADPPNTPSVGDIWVESDVDVSIQTYHAAYSSASPADPIVGDLWIDADENVNTISETSIVLKSPNGTEFQITVENDGTLNTTQI